MRILRKNREEKINSNLTIYPNPASDVLFIESSEEIKSVRILDSKRMNRRTGDQTNGRKKYIEGAGWMGWRRGFTW